MIASDIFPVFLAHNFITKDLAAQKKLLIECLPRPSLVGRAGYWEEVVDKSNCDPPFCRVLQDWCIFVQCTLNGACMSNLECALSVHFLVCILDCTVQCSAVQCKTDSQANHHPPTGYMLHLHSALQCFTLRVWVCSLICTAL